ncbi:MAG: hypothetical protein KF861_15475 [Planctomycetaceae bacterium]|nr:hypothetical protein [Planctomycetaceae bacterium]
MAERPYEFIGAGKLVSALWKRADGRRGWRYRFNIFRMHDHHGTVSRMFRPGDLPDLLKLCQVLAMELRRDGCLPEQERQRLADLADDLDAITRKEAGR